MASLPNEVAWSLNVNSDTWKKTPKIFLNTICKLNHIEKNEWKTIPKIKFAFLLKILVNIVNMPAIGIKNKNMDINDKILKLLKKIKDASNSK